LAYSRYSFNLFDRPGKLVDRLKSLLICDREFGLEGIYTCNRLNIGLPIIPRGRVPLGFTPKLYFTGFVGLVKRFCIYF